MENVLRAMALTVIARSWGEYDQRTRDARAELNRLARLCSK